MADWLRRRDRVLFVSDRRHQLRQSGFKAPERPEPALSNCLEIEQLGKFCLVPSWFVSSFDHIAEPTFGISWALFEVSLRSFGVLRDHASVRKALSRE